MIPQNLFLKNTQNPKKKWEWVQGKNLFSYFYLSKTKFLEYQLCS